MAAAPSSARSELASLARLEQQVRPVVLAGERTLPVDESLAGLFPAGWPRGVTVTVSGGAARSFALVLAAAANRAGSWLAVVGVPGLGWRALAELGGVASRVVVVDMTDPARSADCVAAALDGFDVVLIGAGTRLARPVERRLAARARERGSVLIGVRETWAQGRWVGTTGTGDGQGAFAEVADLRVTTTDEGWGGLGDGSGRLTGRRVSVAVEGKRVPGRRRRAELYLPGQDGHVRAVTLAGTPHLEGVGVTGSWKVSA